MSETKEYYHYTPSLAAAALFTVVFTTSAIAHAIQLTRTRTWYFLPMLIGAVSKSSSSSGLIARAAANFELQWRRSDT